MDASEFFKESVMLGEVEDKGDGLFHWFISYIGDANSGDDTRECHDVTWDDYCEAAEIINKHGYEVIESYSEHDYVMATFKLKVNDTIPESEKCKYCKGTGRWKDGQ